VAYLFINHVIASNISSICEKPSIWSSLPRKLDLHDRLRNKSRYWKYAQADFDHRSVNFISLEFPGEQAKNKYPWGIAWMRRRTAEGIAHGFISMLPSGWVPNNSLEFFKMFLMTLQQQWKASCADANERVEVLVCVSNFIELKPGES